MDNSEEIRLQKIIATQMIIMGWVLIVFGITVTVFSPFRTMDPDIKTWALISDLGMTFTGVVFLVSGLIRKALAEKKLHS